MVGEIVKLGNKAKTWFPEQFNADVDGRSLAVTPLEFYGPLGEILDKLHATAFFYRLALYAIFGGLLVAANVLFDYAKVRAVVEDRRSMIGAMTASARFIRRNFSAVAALYATNGLIFVTILVIYALVAPGMGRTALGVWLGFVVSQLYLLARLWARLVFSASEVALFQGRLAHTGYVASAPLRLSEPPIVEQVVG